MKTTILFIFLLTGSLTVWAQAETKKNTPRSAEGIDISKTGRSVMDVLTPGLKLSNEQTTKVIMLVGQFLTHKSDLAPLKTNNPDQYKTKLAAEQQTFSDGMKAELTAAQYTQFIAMKPGPGETDNVLSPFFD